MLRKKLKTKCHLSLSGCQVLNYYYLINKFISLEKIDVSIKFDIMLIWTIWRKRSKTKWPQHALLNIYYLILY
jgi:hypothetical protein